MAQAKLSMADALQRLHAHVIASAEGKISSTTGVGKFYLQAGPDGAMIKEAFKVARLRSETFSDLRTLSILSTFEFCDRSRTVTPAVTSSV